MVFIVTCISRKGRLGLGIGKAFVNQDKTLIRKFVMEHCPQKLAKYLLNAFMKRTEMLKVLQRMLVPRRLNVYKTL